MGGMLPYSICSRPHVPNALGNGPHGWPCHAGGSARASQTLHDGTAVHSMAFFVPDRTYYPPMRGMPGPQTMLARLQTAATFCKHDHTGGNRSQRPASAALIALNAFASCIFEAFTALQPLSGRHPLRGVAIVPGNVHPLNNSPWPMIGVASPAGFLVTHAFSAIQLLRQPGGNWDASQTVLYCLTSFSTQIAS